MVSGCCARVGTFGTESAVRKRGGRGRTIIVKNSTFLLKKHCAECNKTLCIFCAKIQLDLKTTLIVIVVADEQVKKITNTLTNTFKPLKKVKGEKGHE